MTSTARVVIAVEGVSDRLVLELLARRRGRDLAAEGIEIVPIGGAHAIARFVTELPPHTPVRGLCDANEQYLFRRVLDDVFVCAPDLEGELLRALGVEAVEAVVADTGDLRSFRKFQRQPAQRGRPLEPQLDRWLRSSWRRYQRYLPLLVDALDLDQVPQPLDEVLKRPDGAM
jgi:Overcoming lysogenization defect protein-like, TOPRIM domain